MYIYIYIYGITSRGFELRTGRIQREIHALALMKAFCAYFWIFVGRIEEKRGEFRGWSVVKEPLDDSISFLAKIPPVKLKCRRESIRHSLVRILVRFPPWNILVILRAVYTCRYTAYTRYKGFDCDGQRKWYMVESVLKLQIGSKTGSSLNFRNFVRSEKYVL